ncbi:hypothetical protein WPG_1321 [Winogradskyella sp. PG-2]|nr:hypothetical protein WPG_1321 [Winogradskyella sp. PG-2]
MYYANINFGSTFASTSLTFPAAKASKEPQKKTKPVFKKKRV